MKRNIVYYNARVITVDKKSSILQAFAVAGDKFEAAGSNREILDLAGPETERVDLKGKTVIPGINEGHAHPYQAYLSEREGKIPNVPCLADLFEWISDQTRKKKKGEWISVWRIYATRLADLRLPSREELDKLAPEHPVFLNAAFGGVVNTMALKESSITDKTDHPGVLRDRKTGKLTGVLHRSAFGLLKDAPSAYRPGPGDPEAFKRLVNRYNSVGITSASDTLIYDDQLDLFNKMNQDRTLNLRLYLNYCPAVLKKGGEVRAAIDRIGFKTKKGDEWVRFGQYKTYIDGGILTGTSFLRQPWGKKAQAVFDIIDPTYRGVCNYKLPELIDVIEAAYERGCNFICHVTGDGGNDLLLDAYEAVHKKHDISDMRFDLLHGNFFPNEILERCKAMNVLLDIQGIWFYKDYEAMKSVLGEERLADFHTYRNMWDKGLVICSGSDHMCKLDPDTSINPYNPWLGMYALTTRTTEKGNTVQPGEVLSRMEALQSYTINNAYKSFEEDIKGSIEPGKLADFAVLEKDFLTCSDEELKNMQVETTVVGGRVVYHKS
jgi:predicted amidohydrolase YtcJ